MVKGDGIKLALFFNLFLLRLLTRVTEKTILNIFKSVQNRDYIFQTKTNN